MQLNFKTLLHCRRMHKFLCVSCLVLAMLRSCRNIENSYNNIPGVIFCQFIGQQILQSYRVLYLCSHVANFPRNGNPIISENYIAIAVKSCSGLWPSIYVTLENRASFRHPPPQKKRISPNFKTHKIGRASPF